jgi:hypothetical protein
MTAASLRPLLAMCLLPVLVCAETVDVSAAFPEGARWIAGDHVHVIGETMGAPGDMDWRSELVSRLGRVRPELRIVSSGNGDQTLDLGRFEWLVEGIAKEGVPDVVVIGFGRGEAARGAKAATPSAVGAALGTWVGRLQDAGAIVVLLTPPTLAPGDALEQQLDAYAEAIRQAAGGRGAACIDLRAQLAAAGGATAADGRLTPYGQRQVAELTAAGIGQAMRLAPFSVPLRDSTFIDDHTVDLAPVRAAAPERIEIYVSTDGKPASEKSRRYTKPFRITATTTVDYLAIDRGDRTTRRGRARFEREKPVAAQRGGKRETGLRWGWWNGPKLPADPPEAAPGANGTASGFDLDAARAHPLGAKKEDYAIVFSGFISVPAKAVYTFKLNADDQAVLSVGGREVVRANWPRTSTGTIALEAGQHPIRVALSQGIGGVSLDLWWGGPGMRIQPIADAVLSFDPGADPFVPVAPAKGK